MSEKRKNKPGASASRSKKVKADPSVRTHVLDNEKLKVVDYTDEGEVLTKQKRKEQFSKKAKRQRKTIERKGNLIYQNSERRAITPPSPAQKAKRRPPAQRLLTWLRSLQRRRYCFYLLTFAQGENDASASQSAGGESEQGDVSESEEEAPSGFGDALAAILNREDPILIKNKRAEKKIKAEKAARKLAKQKLAEKKMLANKDHFEPTWENQDHEFEAQLKKTARKGVVQLFNAIYKQQRQAGIDNKDPQAEALSKERFLQLLSKSEGPAKPRADIVPLEKPKWDVLADDYLTGGGASIKEWKRSEREPVPESSSEVLSSSE